MARSIRITEDVTYESNQQQSGKNSSYVEFKIDKRTLIRNIRSSLIIGALMGYLALMYFGYQLSAVYFWSLLKVGVIVGLLGGLAIINKQ